LAEVCHPKGEKIKTVCAEKFLFPKGGYLEKEVARPKEKRGENRDWEICTRGKTLLKKRGTSF